ncbi:helix-turn-helix domain-containing protein [Desulfobulbus rhabdoformis]|uniref:helix-turn-helix domain-containing protein n=1 Tax=Desulfobulbus rhabdoformis TaxID=34032 RepID=UPI001964DF87|nr:helix-turn-helix domain-containing protein [Desulfobulbus rhabdoformis]MBM9616528.1 helix-turn-helix domain-containing protein [Desulfobulbus rhabdoformis]
MSDSEYVVTQKEAAEFLKVSTKSISRYRKRGLPFKLILNPSTGKQEVRFRYADLERWDEGRQLLSTYARDAETTSQAAAPRAQSSVPMTQPDIIENYLGDLLSAYKDQIELLKEQLEDMRVQLSRRDRQIDDLMRLMVGLQLEYNPMPSENTSVASSPQVQEECGDVPEMEVRSDGMYEVMDMPEVAPSVIANSAELEAEVERTTAPEGNKKIYSQEELSRSIQRLRAKGKSFEEIAHGLNQINVATLSGRIQWSVHEVQQLLPPLVESPGRF